jgi:hypothetical protein
MWTTFCVLIVLALIYSMVKKSNGEGGVSRTSKPLHCKPCRCDRCGGTFQDIGGYHHLGLTVCSLCASVEEQNEGEFTYGDYGF